MLIACYGSKAEKTALLSKKISLGIRFCAAILSCAFVLDADYIEVTLGASTFMRYGLLAAVWIISLLYCVKRDIKINCIGTLEYLTCAYLLLLTLINSGSLLDAVRYLLPLLTFVTFASVLTKNELDLIFNQWRIVLTLLLLVDLLSMLIYPNGMYVATATGYTENWFLGYKTARVSSLYFLLVILAYRWHATPKSKGIIDGLIAALVCVDAILSQGSSLFLGMFFFIACAMLFNSRFTMVRNAIRSLLNYRVFFLVYLLATVAVVVFQNTDFISFLSDGLGKSSTLSGRTTLWSTTLRNLKGNIFGAGFLSQASYIQLTGGYLNTHNHVLESFTVGGLPFLISQVLSIRNACIGKERVSTAITLRFALYGLLVIGFTSAKIVFEPVLFFLLTVLERNIVE